MPFSSVPPISVGTCFLKNLLLQDKVIIFESVPPFYPFALRMVQSECKRVKRKSKQDIRVFSLCIKLWKQWQCGPYTFNHPGARYD